MAQIGAERTVPMVFLKQFRDDYEAHIKAKKCPFPESFEV